MITAPNPNYVLQLLHLLQVIDNKLWNDRLFVSTISSNLMVENEDEGQWRYGIQIT